MLMQPQKKPSKALSYRQKLLNGLIKRKPRSRLKPVSERRSKANEKYAKAKAAYLKANRTCEICGKDQALSIHHIGGRSGSKLYDPDNFMTLCLIGDYLDRKFPEANHSHAGGCHGFVEGNKDLAREKQWIR